MNLHPSFIVVNFSYLEIEMTTRTAAGPSTRRRHRSVELAKKNRKGLLGVDKTSSLMVESCPVELGVLQPVEGGIHKPLVFGFRNLR